MNQIINNNLLLNDTIKFVLDCSNNININIFTDASNEMFALDNLGNKIEKQQIKSVYYTEETLTITFYNSNLNKQEIVQTSEAVIDLDYSKLTTDLLLHERSIILKNTDNYWYRLLAKRSMLDNYDLSYCSPITEINVTTIGKEINKIFGVNSDVSGNSFDYDLINNKIGNFINIYTTSYGIDFANDNNNLAIENRYLKNITYYPSENCEVNSAIITFENNSTFTLLDYNKHWYKAGIYTRIVFDSSATPISYPFVQYSDNEKLFSILINLINKDNTILMSISYDSLGNNCVTNNDNSLIYNRYVLNVYYTPGIIDQSNGYLTITFGNQSTFTIIDNVDKYFYNIKIR